MPEVLRIGPADASALSGLEGGVKAVDAATLARHAPDAHFMLLEGRKLLARCSAWWTATPQLDGSPAGAIGHYAAIDASAGSRVLAAACAALREQGARVAVGPMDGNTWRSYRFVTSRGDSPPFLLEPWQPEDWPAHFEQAGFAPLATYHSALCEDIGEPDPRAAAAGTRLEGGGVRIRSVVMADFEGELRRLHALSAESFERNFMYTPLDEDEFVQQYLPIAQHVVAELVLIAECGTRVVGYVFALPDWNEARSAAPPRSIIVKTVAVAAGRSYAGLGVCLVARVHEVARGLGYTRAVHALMHDENNSANVSRRYSRVMRRYTLYARPLDPA